MLLSMKAILSIAFRRGSVPAHAFPNICSVFWPFLNEIKITILFIYSSTDALVVRIFPEPGGRIAIR